MTTSGRLSSLSYTRLLHGIDLGGEWGGVVLVVVKIRRQEFAGAIMGQSFELRRRRSMSLKCLYTTSAGGFSPSG